MRQGTFALSQKELQRVSVITSCVKGDLACARAASLLNLTPRHVKRLKSRLRQGGEAALAHASRGRPSHRRLLDRVRDRILHLARTIILSGESAHAGVLRNPTVYANAPRNIAVEKPRAKSCQREER